MNIESVAIKDLAFDPANARKHDKANLDAIKGSLTRFGQQKPIVVDGNGVVVAGNGTLAAAKSLKWKSIEVVKTELTGSDAVAYALADNRTAELAEWDNDILDAHLEALAKEGHELESIGFSSEDFSFLDDKPEPLTDADEIPEVEQNIHNVKTGQIWQLGAHRLMCGDSTSKEDVDELMGGEKADMVFTDPPYGINYKSVSLQPHLLGSKIKSKNTTILNDENTDTFRQCFSDILSNMECDKIIWGGNYFSDFLPVNGHWIVWNKLKFDKPGQNFSNCELAWTNAPKDMVRMYSHTWDGAFRQGTKKDECKTRIHPNQKPVGMIALMLVDYDRDLILDLFLGSGSTLIACEKTNRKCYGMEIDPHYCSVIIERWQNFTGQKANLLDKA